jgi:hypothetical protein
MTRATFERLCRVVALTALAAALVTSWRGARARDGGTPGRFAVRLADSLLADTGGAALSALRVALLEREALPGAAQRGLDTLLLPLGAIPSPGLRAALGSVRANGVPLRWLDSTRARGLAASVSRAAAPGAPIDVRVATSPGRTLALRDAGGVLDSVASTDAVMSWRLRSASTPLRVELGRSALTAGVPDSTRARRVLVFAQPGWEGKFVVAALEEAGWLVDGSLRVSPSGRVTIGAPQRLDTARYAAVVMLDSMAVDGALLAQFVTRGGGLVLGGDALRVPALAALRPARATELRGAIAGGLLTETPRHGLEAWELDVAGDAVVLDVDGGDHAHEEPALVARRLGAGRVVAMPYRETWRWRMQGSDDGLSQHRSWWQAAITTAVGVAPAAAGAGDREMLPGAAAPYADLVARVGAAARPGTAQGVSPTGDERERSGDIPLPLRPWVLLLSAVMALLAEWSSRRLRGAR